MEYTSKFQVSLGHLKHELTALPRHPKYPIDLSCPKVKMPLGYKESRNISFLRWFFSLVKSILNDLLSVTPLSFDSNQRSQHDNVSNLSALNFIRISFWANDIVPLCSASSMQVARSLKLVIKERLNKRFADQVQYVQLGSRRSSVRGVGAYVMQIPMLYLSRLGFGFLVVESGDNAGNYMSRVEWSRGPHHNRACTQVVISTL